MATREQIMNALRQADQAGDTQAAQRFAAMISGGQFDTPPAVEQPGVGTSLAAGAAQGATFGFGDEAAAALRTGGRKLTDLVGASPQAALFEFLNPEYSAESFKGVQEETGPKSYEEFIAQGREFNREAQQANPGAYLTGEIGTGLAAGAGPARLAVKGTQTLRQAIPRLAGVGAAEGGVAGAGFSEADTLPEFAGDVAAGTATGAILGAALPAAGKGISTAVQRFGPESIALRRVLQDLKDSGITPEQAQKTLDANPNMILADLSENLQQRLGGVAQAPGATPQAARKLLEGRSIGQQQRFGSLFSKALNDTPVGEAAEAAVQRTRASAGPLYDAAYEAVIPPNAQIAIAKLLERPAGKAALRKAQTLAKNEGVDIDPDGPLNVRTLDYVQRALRNNAEAVGRSSPGNARPIKAIRTQLLEMVDSASPDFRAARRIAADEFANKDALELGKKVFTETTPNLRRTLGDMAESEREHFRIGVFEKVADMMADKSKTADITRLFSTPKREQALRLAFDNDALYAQFKRQLGNEQNMQATMAKALTGSPTASRQAFGQVGVREPTINPLTLAGRGVQALANRGMQGPAQTANTAVGQALLGRNPQQLMQQLAQPQPLGQATAALASPAAIDPQRQLDQLLGR